MKHSYDAFFSHEWTVDNVKQSFEEAYKEWGSVKKRTDTFTIQSSILIYYNLIFSPTFWVYYIDESPMSYKKMEDIITNISDTVEIIKVIKPVYNFKAK